MSTYNSIGIVADIYDAPLLIVTAIVGVLNDVAMVLSGLIRDIEHQAAIHIREPIVIAYRLDRPFLIVSSPIAPYIYICCICCRLIFDLQHSSASNINDLILLAWCKFPSAGAARNDSRRGINI